MTAAATSSYDQVPYGFRIYTAAHPDRLAVIARLVGLDTPPVDRCRVLDLGCAAGGNLIPLAVALPQATFVGVDLSPLQISQGNAAITELGLKNISLHARDILSIGEELGTFDYLICHGVFSWVPPAVQDHILSLCRRLLAPNGVAYVSYNAYPAWHVRQILRDAMLFHTEGVTDPDERVRQARTIIEFLGESFANPDGYLPKLLQVEIKELREAPSWYLFHEFLESDNQPMRLYQFVDRARRQGLAYMGDAMPAVIDSKINPAARETIAQMSADPAGREQYVDFLTLRTFHASVLCQREARPVRRTPAESLALLRLSSVARPVADQPEWLSDRSEEFRLENGGGIHTNNPVIKSALRILIAAWPRSVPFPDLCDQVVAVLGERAAQMRPALEANLAVGMVNSFVPGVVEMRFQEPPLVTEPGERPLASPAARLWAREVGEQVVNLRHRLVSVDTFQRELLTLLDGTRNRAALHDHFLQLHHRGELSVEHEGQPVREEDQLRTALTQRIESGLRQLGRLAFLLA